MADRLRLADVLGALSIVAHFNYTIVGDDLQGNHASQRTNFADARSLLTTMLRQSTRSLPPLARAKAVARIAAGGSGIGKTLETASCEVAQTTARRVGLSGGVQRSLHEVMEWWNGTAACTPSEQPRTWLWLGTTHAAWPGRADAPSRGGSHRDVGSFLLGGATRVCRRRVPDNSTGRP